MNSKLVQFVLVLLAISFLTVSCGNDDTNKNSPNTKNEKYYEKIPVIDAYYQGQKVWFIHTDATSKEMALRLSKMVAYPTNYTPYFAEGVDKNKIAKIYVFKNGINQAGKEPWGGGPFQYQIDIVNAVPGDTNYTPLKNPYIVSWNKDAEARILKSESALLEAAKNGELTIQQTDIIVNAPIVRWQEKR